MGAHGSAAPLASLVVLIEQAVRRLTYCNPGTKPCIRASVKQHMQELVSQLRHVSAFFMAARAKANGKGCSTGWSGSTGSAHHENIVALGSHGALFRVVAPHGFWQSRGVPEPLPCSTRLGPGASAFLHDFASLLTAM